MSHPSEGLLRRAVDEPAAMGDAERRHIAACASCRSELAAAVADRDAVAAALAVPGEPAGPPLGNGLGARLEPAGVGNVQVRGGEAGHDAGHEAGVDVDAAWHRLAATLDGADPRVAPLAGPPPRQARRRGLRRPMVAVVAAAAVAVGTTAAAAAADWLPIFEPKQVTAVTLDLQKVDAMPDLDAYGTLSVPGGDAEPERVGSAAEAEERTGFDVPDVAALPQGVSGTAEYAVIERTTGRFTFSAAKAREAAARTGQKIPPMPSGVDGAVLEVRIGPGVIATWNSGGPVPKLGVLRMAAPVASSQGVSLATLRDYLLAQPGIPADTAAQLRQLPDDGSVLPVPVPSRYATTSSTSVDGVPATQVALRDGSAAGVLWIKDNVLTAVVGLLDVEDVTEVARGLR
jgi:hypothetical protein